MSKKMKCDQCEKEIRGEIIASKGKIFCSWECKGLQKEVKTPRMMPVFPMGLESGYTQKRSKK